MSKVLTINGKEYVQSTELSTTFKYSSDYIAKLAREEKIIGTLIGRQWFIEPESLKTFLVKAEIEKNIRKEEISKQRKKERKEYESAKPSIQIELPVSIVGASTALAQSVAIVLCGLIVGGLGWVSSVENIGTVEISRGVHDSLSLVASAIVPSQISQSQKRSPSSFVVATEDSFNELQNSPHELSFTELPVFPERDISVTDSTVQEVVSWQNKKLIFSDEVEIVIDDSGNELIKPIFKNKTQQQTYPLLMTVNEREN